AIEQALKQMGESVKARNFPEYANADAAFHLAIVQAVGNDILTTLYENLYGLITDMIQLSVRVPSKSLKAGLEEHEDLYRIICSGDPEKAREAIAAHLENSASYLQTALAETKIPAGNDVKA